MVNILTALMLLAIKHEYPPLIRDTEQSNVKYVPTKLQKRSTSRRMRDENPQYAGQITFPIITD